LISVCCQSVKKMSKNPKDKSFMTLILLFKYMTCQMDMALQMNIAADVKVAE